MIEIPSQLDPKELYIAGSCWTRSVYSKYDIPFDWPTSTAMSDYRLDLDLLADSAMKKKAFLLQFAKPVHGVTDEKTRILRLVVGNCKLNEAKSEKAGNFEVFLPVSPRQKEQTYFTCDALKGNCAAGAESRIGFIFNQPAIDPLLSELEVLRGVGQWVEVKAELKLAAGFIPPGVPEPQMCEVILRAYVQQI